MFLAEDGPPVRLFVGNLDPSVNSFRLKSIFQSKGRVLGAKVTLSITSVVDPDPWTPPSTTSGSSPSSKARAAYWGPR